MNYRWEYNTEEGVDYRQKIFLERGLLTEEAKAEFLSEKPKKTYPPEMILNMGRAVDCILKHIDLGNKIVIAGDYDMDGIGAVAVLVEYLTFLQAQVAYYIPNRYVEGYGLSIESIDAIQREHEPQLLITVDNGISCVKEVAYAKSLGIEVIVTDHHMPPEILPEALILNVKQEGDLYPFKELCGCGLAFKLCQALKNRLKLDKSHLNALLDIVALSTIGDVVTLKDENRTLVKYGLHQIKSGKRLGIRSLVEALEMDLNSIRSGAIGFRLAPCFNASGRIEDAKIGVKLLLTKDIAEATYYANYLKNLNEERKAIQASGEAYCQEQVELKHMGDDFLVIREDQVSEGVMGIIAGRIRERYYKPTLVVTKVENGLLKGSGRSIDGVNIYEEMKACQDLLEGFGGHANACGFSIKEENLEALRQALNASMAARKAESAELFTPAIKVVDNLGMDDLDFELLDFLAKLEPFGMGNPTPQFALQDIKIMSKQNYCGEQNQHFKLWGQCQGISINGIGFQLGEKYLLEGEPQRIDVVFSPQVNEWQGKKTIQLSLKDFKESC